MVASHVRDSCLKRCLRNVFVSSVLRFLAGQDLGSFFVSSLTRQKNYFFLESRNNSNSSGSSAGEGSSRHDEKNGKCEPPAGVL